MKKLIGSSILTAALALCGIQAHAATPYVMSIGNYLENFSDVTNWTAAFASGVGAAPYGSVAVNATGTIPDGQKTTVSSATFSVNTSGGVQKGVSNMVFLTTGTTDNAAALAVDLFLDFTGRTAGALSFDWATVFNSTGDRRSSLRVYTSIDGTTWTELTGAAVLNLANNVAASGSITAVALPATFNGSATARMRFYECNGTGGTTGSRAKISIDNLAVTSTPSGGAVPPTITLNPPAQTTNWTGSNVTFTVAAIGDAPLSYRWQSNLVDLANGGQVSGATSNTLTISAADASFETGFRVIVTNLSGAATSSVANLVLATAAPTITSSPFSRAGILGALGTFQVAYTMQPIANAPATTIQWQSNGVNIANSGRFSGATSTKLTITGLVADDAGTYSCIVSNIAGGGPSGGATLTVGSSGTLSAWNFNIATNPSAPEVYYGPGSAALAGSIVGTFPGISGDGNDTHTPNRYWSTDTYPSNPVLPATNKTSGVRFNASTVGLRNVSVHLSTKLSASASKYSRLQYTTNGTAFIDYPGSSTNMAIATLWDSTGGAPANAGRIFDLSGFPGVRNNANFGVRIVTETENTATYGTSPVTNFVGVSSTYGSGGTVSYDLVDIEAAVTNANAAPTIVAIGSFSMADSDPATNITLNLADAETATGSLTVTAKSFNPAVIPDSLTPSTTTLTLTPTVGNLGTAPILVTVSDPDGNSASTWFNVTVTGNGPPTIFGLVNTNTFTNTPVSQTFTIGDDLTPVGSLTLAAFSGNTNLVPNSNIGFTGTGATRTNTVTGVTGASGIAPISVVVTDGSGKKATNTYAVMIRASTNILVVDGFDYDTAGPLTTNSIFFWANYGGTAGQADVGSGVLNLTSTESEDVLIPLIGAPYSTNSPVILYSSFVLKTTGLPAVDGDEVGFYKTSSSATRANVWTSISNTVAPGTFRLGIGGGSTGTAVSGQVLQDLNTNTSYTVVTRFVVSNRTCQIWVNPTTEAATNATNYAVAGELPTTFPDITGYGFQQNTGMGTLTINNLKVGTSFDAVHANPAPTPENIVFTTSGSNLILSWTQLNWTALLSGTSITALTTTNVGATSPYTNALSGSQTYFRLYYAP